MAECGRCGNDLVKRHCDGKGCGWVVCGDAECGATTDATQDDIYFERKSPETKRRG